MSCIKTTDWQDKIFGLNQYMFAIWQFLEFPYCLSLCAVHSTWRRRLWPYTTMPATLSQSTDPLFFDHEAASYCSVARDLTIPVTHSEASYALCITKATIHRLPPVSSHCTPLLKQFFTCYNHIETLVILTPNHRYYLGSTSFPAQSKCFNTLLTEWSQIVGKKHLTIYYNHTVIPYHSKASIFDFQPSNIQLQSLEIFDAWNIDSFQFLLCLPVLKIHFTNELNQFGRRVLMELFTHLVSSQRTFVSQLAELHIHMSKYSLYGYAETLTLDLSLFPVLQKLHIQLGSIQIHSPGSSNQDNCLNITALPVSFTHLTYPCLFTLPTSVTCLLQSRNINIVQV